MRRCVSPLAGRARGRRRLLGIAAVLAAAAVAGAALGADGAAPPTGERLAQLSAPPAASPLATQRIYFLMTDRYANGDPSNDRGGLTGTRAATGYDPSGAGWFHGGDLAGLTGSCESDPHGLARIKALGFTSIWITPPFGQRAVQGDSAAYHGYWITDFTAPDRHLGTAAEFGAMVDCAHRLGLQVILDVVVNHTADVISLTGGSGGYVGPEQVPYRDCRGKAFHPAAYIGKPFPCTSRRDMPRVPLAARRRPHREEAGVAQRPDPLPRPRRHRLLVVQRDVPRAGRLLRPRRPVHRAARRRARPRGRLRGLDRALQDRRDPDRHGAPRQRRVLPAMAPRDPRRGASGRGPRFRRLRGGLRRRHARALSLRP